jgi:histidine triad (HIT) family protein/ATP adenylyltransferase
VTADRLPPDPDALAAYVQRAREGPCFVCATIAGDPEYRHEMLLDDGEHVAFLSRYPTLYGYALVCPRRHVEHVVRDLELDKYLSLQAVVHRVARAVEEVVAPERTYLLSLGSQQGNTHVHWHVAPLPPGTPYEHQQYHALMGEHGLIPWSDERAAELAQRIRAVLSRGKSVISG